jgi:protein involved in polysaccharide export with SLBB domain
MSGLEPRREGLTSMSRRSIACLLSPIVVSTLLIAVSAVVAGPQEGADPKTAKKVEKAGQEKDDPPRKHAVKELRSAEDQIDKLIAEYDLKPHPLVPIPDDPPPHEGALIDLPYVVEPPDLIIVEVLEALPGRPISGERLVRPDGKISLSFYGEVPVRGLTIPQVKVAILKHLRNCLPDETLGLLSSPATEPFSLPAETYLPRVRKPAIIPELPDEKTNPFQKLEEPRPSTDRPPSAKTRSPSRPETRGHIPVRRVRQRETRLEPQDQEVPAKERNPIKVDGVGKGKVTITVEFDGQDRPAAEPVLPEPLADKYEGPWQVVPPEESSRIFVDVTAYNSKNYYVLGDVQVPGKLPWTGNETVLEALQYAGGLMASAEPKDIRLIRPARGGKPARVYKVDLEAIRDRGEITLNYQLFPGDRLVVGRNEVVKKTEELDRLNAPLQSVTGSILQAAFALRYVQILSPERSDEIMKKLIDFWAKEISRKGDLKLDEQKLRELLLHELNKPPATPPAAPAPRPR